VVIAVNEAGMSSDVSIYSADVSTADIAVMREPGSPWKATVATNPAVVGEVSVRALAIMLAGGDPGAQVVVPPTLITQDFLNEADISNMEDLSSAMPQFQHADVAMTDWMPLPPRSTEPHSLQRQSPGLFQVAGPDADRPRRAWRAPLRRSRHRRAAGCRRAG
jgi:simple sugar transport system substrate-binding protein